MFGDGAAWAGADGVADAVSGVGVVATSKAFNNRHKRSCRPLAKAAIQKENHQIEFARASIEPAAEDVVASHITHRNGKSYRGQFLPTRVLKEKP